MQIIAADNSTLSNFAKLELITPLFLTFKKIIICTGVEQEIKTGVEKGYLSNNIIEAIDKAKILVEPVDTIEMLSLVANLQKKYPSLSYADATSIALARFKKVPLAIDEKIGITAAQAYNIVVLTTVNILEQWQREKVFTNADLNVFLDRLESECSFKTKPKFRF